MPVFVLTHYARESIAMQGGRTFHFVTDGIEAALQRAREAASGRDVRLGGGVATIRQYLRAGLRIPGAAAHGRRTAADKQRSIANEVTKDHPFLWYSSEAEEAAAFYAGIFPDSRVIRVTAMPAESPSGPPGSVKVVEFVLCGQPFVAMSAGPLDPFNHAVSFVVNCDDQAEIDRYWDALLVGGAAEACGWLKDRFGLSWQIVPTVLGEMMADPDPLKARRAAEAMMKMVKLDIVALQAAYSGTSD